MCFEGTEDELKLTANTQPAILTVSVAAYRVLAEKGIAAGFVAGHSLGEYSALVAAGSLRFVDAVKLVRKRGTVHAGGRARRTGRMAAIMGLSPTVVQDAVQTRRRRAGVSARQSEFARTDRDFRGMWSAVKRAVEIASQSGAKRAVMLAGFRSVSFGADDAGAGEAGEGSGSQ